MDRVSITYVLVESYIYKYYYSCETYILNGKIPCVLMKVQNSVSKGILNELIEGEIKAFFCLLFRKTKEYADVLIVCTTKPKTSNFTN